MRQFWRGDGNCAVLPDTSKSFTALLAKTKAAKFFITASWLHFRLFPGKNCCFNPPISLIFAILTDY
jgi:hypothetical protein